jgi:outer membrane protein assembly factor BamB
VKKTIAIIGLALIVQPALAGDWMQFRGPGGSGVSPEKGLPVKWTATENLRWKAALPGRGLSCPVVTGDKVLVTACSGYRQTRLHVLCFRASDGTKLWERQFTATGNTQCNPKTSMAAPTPVTDGKAVYALFATGDLAALDLDGNLLWYRSLVGDYPDITNQVGMASSPVLWKNVLLLPMENAGDSFAAGIDTKTGKNLWRVKRPRVINWATPRVVERDGRTEALFQTGADLTAYDPKTGKELWSLKDQGTSDIVSSIEGEGLLFVPGQDFLALKPGKAGQAPEIVWKSSRLRSNFGSPVYHEGRIYGLAGKIALNCLDARNGKLLWQQRIRGPFSATPIIADGKAYVVAEDGVVTVVKLGPEPEILAQNPLGETILATPAVANGALYLRSDRTLFCVGRKQGK